jgi:hypothetical protein
VPSVSVVLKYLVGTAHSFSVIFVCKSLRTCFHYSKFSFVISDNFQLAEFTTNKHGNPQIVDTEGFVYSKHRAIGPLVQWRCHKSSKREGWTCTARATTEGEHIVKRIGQHVHPP